MVLCGSGSIKQPHPGVGTNRLTRLRGGLFGYGLSRHLRKGYDWLARHYAQGDRIFIFGFSRGP